MKTLLTFDHIIVAVRDLDAATADYQALGFTAYYGGQHTHKQTHNALISLVDGSYLELLAPVDPANANEAIEILAHGEGFGGYALLSTDLTADAARLRTGGLAFSGPNAGHRTRYDGERVAWQTLNFAETPRAPFLIADETAHVLRVPADPDKTQHANGVIGVAELVVAVRDLAAAAARYAAILGQPPQSDRAAGSDRALDGAQTVAFALENCTLTLAAPRAEDGALAAYLSTRGEMPYRLHLRTSQPDWVGELDSVQSHGAHIELVC